MATTPLSRPSDLFTRAGAPRGLNDRIGSRRSAFFVPVSADEPKPNPGLGMNVRRGVRTMPLVVELVETLLGRRPASARGRVNVELVRLGDEGGLVRKVCPGARWALVG